MPTPFKTIAIYGRHRSDKIADTLETLITCLQKYNCQLCIEQTTAESIKHPDIPRIPYTSLGQQCDLVIVVGGDGSLLNAAHQVVQYNTPIVGINRGKLGFLTDISPHHIEAKIQALLAGHYDEEARFFISAQIEAQGKIIYQNKALNDIVLLPGEYAHMITFDLNINRELVCEHRADGLIISTPTGSTAYALSGGGPILHPALEAVVLVPMFPHTLSSRPIVVPSHSDIVLHINANNETSPCISCDGQARVAVPPDAQISIRRLTQTLRLIHPKDYNYYETLRDKLGWQTTH